MNKLLRPEIIVTLSLLPAVFLVFVERDELFMLFLIELGFLCAIGFAYVGLVLATLAIASLIKKRLWKIKKKMGCEENENT